MQRPFEFHFKVEIHIRRGLHNLKGQPFGSPHGGNLRFV